MSSRSSRATPTSSLGSHLAQRGELILERWRSAVDADPQLPKMRTLSRTQFDDHIPYIVEDFAAQLARAEGGNGQSSRAETKEDISAHGLSRWQQGYELHQLTREWGHLQLVLLDAIEEFFAQQPTTDPAMRTRALRILAQLCTEGVSESAARYWRLHQAEAAGQLRDLESTLARMSAEEQARTASWRGAAHDLRGGFGAVEMATVLLEETTTADERQESLALLKQNVSSLRCMLDELLDLARLEAGRDVLEVAAFDAGELLRTLCDSLETLAQSRQLYLRGAGPATLRVEGDRRKVARVVQNLVINAIKYTTDGGITLHWAEDPAHERWSVCVADTGPGLTPRSQQNLRGAIASATSAAAEIAEGHREMRPEPGHDGASPPGLEAPGEGIGLTIVKRLCDLLDAIVELESETGRGSTFRVHFPCRYPTPSSSEAREASAMPLQ